MCSPSTVAKVNGLFIRHLHFVSVRGDLLEGDVYDKLSAVMLPDATFPSPRAQNRQFCALFAFGNPIFGPFEHKIEVFVSEWAVFPGFLALSSTKSRFLCAEGL